jgi:hypothetical protein
MIVILLSNSKQTRSANETTQLGRMFRLSRPLASPQLFQLPTITITPIADHRSRRTRASFELKMRQFLDEVDSRLTTPTIVQGSRKGMPKLKILLFSTFYSSARLVYNLPHKCGSGEYQQHQ